MSKAKKIYYEFVKEADDFGGLRSETTDYVKELEEQKKEMLEILINLIKKNLIDDKQTDTEICETIEKITEKKIKEILK